MISDESCDRKDLDAFIEDVDEIIEKMMDTNNFASERTDSVRQPFVSIIEQPARCALRFRYECEGRSAGSIPGTSTTSDNKTYPTIQVANYKGPAVVVVSCVTKDAPYRPHPHNLVGKEGCKKGVCTMVINNQEMICSFTSLGIQCVKRKDIEDSLKLREAIKVDPYRTGFAHKTQTSNIDLNAVRLCFQVFIEGPEKDKFTVPLTPVVSDPIFDKKAMSDLIINKLSHCSAPVTGGKEIILLCDRVTKDDVQIRFYEEKNGQLHWEGFAEFQPNDVHKQVAICFRTPRYYNESIQQPIMVQLQLRRPSDGLLSEARPFQLLPKEADPEGLARKRQKIEEGCIDRFFRESILNMAERTASGPSVGASNVLKTIAVPRLTAKIKTEPRNETSEVVLASDTWMSATSASNSPIHQAHPQPSQQPSSFQLNIPLAKATQSSEIGAMHQILRLNTSNFSTSFSTLSTNAMNSTVTSNFNNVNNNVVDGPLIERLDSLDLDIDPNDLMNDINFNNMMVMMDSGNNITFNSSGNITENVTANGQGSLDTPQILDISDSSRNVLASPAQLARLHNDLFHLQNHVNSAQSNIHHES